MRSSTEVREARRFGGLMSAAALGYGLWPLLTRGQPPRVWALAAAAICLLLAAVAPRSLEAPRRCWHRLGEALGRLNAWLVLSLVFYLLITPIGIVRRLLGSDPMGRRFDPEAETYRVRRAARPPQHLTQQF